MGSVHIFHPKWPYFKENLLKFCVFGVGSQNFPLKNFACEVHLRGVPTELLHFLGVEIYQGSVGNERDSPHDHQHGEHHHYHHHHQMPTTQPLSTHTHHTHDGHGHHHHTHIDHGVFQNTPLRAAMLLLALSFHSVFEVGRDIVL